MSYFQPYLYGIDAIASLAVCLLVGAALLSTGCLLSRPGRAGGVEFMAGWGIAASVPALTQWLLVADLRWLGALLAIVGVGAAIHQRHALRDNDLWRPAVLMSPALVVACGVPLDEWDSFSHWGINTAYLWRFDALPAPELPGSPSSNPDYPYGYPLVLYLASLVRGAYIENAGAIFNMLTLVAVSSGLALQAAGHDRERLRARPWHWSAWGVLAILAFNPGFVRSITLATYADVAFAASLFFLCLTSWRLATRSRVGAAEWAATAAVAVAMVSVKEGGLFTLGVVAIALGLTLARQAGGAARLPASIAALVPAAVVAGSWQAWVAGWLPSSFSILPWSEWRFGLLPELLASMGALVLEHGHYYALLCVVLGLGVRGWWRARDPADLFHALAALVIMGHLLSLFLAYLGASFTEAEVARAASFHRYATQLAPLALASALLAIGTRLRQSEWRARRPGWAVAACALIMLAGSPYLHRERTETERFYLEVGRRIVEELAPSARIGLLGWQDAPYGYFLLRYELYRPGSDRPGPTLERVFRPLQNAGAARQRQLERLLGRESLSHLAIIETGLREGSRPDMLLLARRGDRWERLDQW